MANPISPAALAEIRERDAKTDPELFEYDNIVGIVGTIGMPKLVSAVRDRRALLADYGEREKRTAGLVHELLECQAEVSRLTQRVTELDAENKAIRMEGHGPELSELWDDLQRYKTAWLKLVSADPTCSECEGTGLHYLYASDGTPDTEIEHGCECVKERARIAVDAVEEIERLTSELAAARKPQGIKFPRAIDSEVATGWTLSPALVRRVWSAYRAMPNAALPETSLTQTEALLLALESLGAQDGGEDKS